MADFVQTMNDWKRMCNEMGKENEYTACDRCGLKEFGCPAIYERGCDDANWNRVEKVVTAWAAEHPVPVYPTWREWLLQMGLFEMRQIDPRYEGRETSPNWDTLLKPIPADIAQKLGIEPKEG